MNFEAELSSDSGGGVFTMIRILSQNVLDFTIPQSAFILQLGVAHGLVQSPFSWPLKNTLHSICLATFIQRLNSENIFPISH